MNHFILKTSNQTEFLVYAGGRLNLNSQALTHLRVCHLESPKTDVCVIKLLAATFGDQRIKGFREKGE